MHQAGFATAGVLLGELHHELPVGRLVDERTVGVERQRAVGLAQVRVAVVGVLDQECRVILARHGVVVARAENVTNGRAEFDEVLAIAGQALDAHGESARCSVAHHVADGFGEIVAQQAQQAIGQRKAHEWNVFEVLHIDMGDLFEERS